MAAYWIARVTVTDEAAYGEYAKRNGPAIEKYGGRFLARGGRCVALEGGARPRNVVIEFPSFEQAVECYNSPEYQEAWEFQKNAATRDIYVVEGV